MDPDTLAELGPQVARLAEQLIGEACTLNRLHYTLVVHSGPSTHRIMLLGQAEHKIAMMPAAAMCQVNTQPKA